MNCKTGQSRDAGVTLEDQGRDAGPVHEGVNVVESPAEVDGSGTPDAEVEALRTELAEMRRQVARNTATCARLLTAVAGASGALHALVAAEHDSPSVC